MTITQISNYFNAIVQSYVDMGFYHYGWTSDINVNVQNNFTGNNSRGKKYPALHMDFITERPTILTKDVRSQATIPLIFSDTQYYNSENNSTNLRSLPELHTHLQQLAINVISEFNRIGRSLKGRDHFGVLTTQPTFTYTANSRNDRLVELFTQIEVFYFPDCTDFTADIEGLLPPFNTLPTGLNDYELE